MPNQYIFPLIIISVLFLNGPAMADEEMKKLDIPSLQDDGYIFLWVNRY